MSKSAVEKANERYKKEAQRLISENEQELILTVRIDLPTYLKYRTNNPSGVDDILRGETSAIFTMGSKILEHYLELNRAIK